MIWLLCLLLLAAPQDARDAAARTEAENLGVGQMGRFDFDAGVQTFTKLLELHDDPDTRVNLAIATLNRQREGDSEAAMKLIEQVLAAHPDHLRARYIRGLLQLNAARAAEAIEQFQVVAEKDPRDPYAAYYVAQCFASAGRHEEALTWYEKASAIDPFLRSAYYGAFQSLQRLKKMPEAKAKLEHFQKLKDHLQARLVEFKYTRMGPKAEVIVTAARGEASPAPPPSGPAFADPVPLSITNAADYPWKRNAHISAADIDSDGKIDLFITAGDRNAVLFTRGETFELSRDHPLAHTEDVNAVLWGDYDNDGLVDCYFLRHGPNQLWRQTEKGKWQDVTESTRTFGGNLEHVAGAFFDADHDGDLDLYLVNSNAPNELLNNDGNGTFRAIGKETGVGGDGRPSRDVLVNDLDNDGDADIVVLKQTPPHELSLNDRFWKYHKPEKGFEPFINAPAEVASAVDTNADGQIELHTARMIDFDGSGVPKALDEPQLHCWQPVTLDPIAGPSIVGFGADRGPMIKRPGPGRHPFLALSLSGKSKIADQMRSNASGIGVKIAVRAGSRWIAADTYPPNQQPIAIGLGGAKQADFIRLTWPEGLLQTELNLPTGKLHIIEETQRQTSSCPILFAWNGQRYAFITDCLGVGGIGFAIGRDQYAEPRPWENVLLPENALAPIENQYRIKLAEPMEEACYLDSAKLVAYDLPPGWSMTLDERMGTNDPQPTGKARFYQREMLPSRAINDRNEDITAHLRSADQSAAPVGAADSRFIGHTRQHAVTMTFPHPLDANDGIPTLLADAWIEYPYSQTMFAAWQARAPYEPPTVEARAPDGDWVTILPQFGYPAGMPRQISVPLPRVKLPRGATELRIRTTQEIYWDRIVLAWAEPCPQAKTVALPLASSRLSEPGFPTRATAPQRRPIYDYDRRAPLWNARHQAGFYTDFGPADELIAAPDGALAIFGPGEEIHLNFAAPIDAPPQGWTRRFVLQLQGWCKDADFHTKDGQTLTPLPGERSPAAAELHERFNTRYRDGH